MNIAIVGGGAAGFFAAINIMEKSPSAHVTIYEAASRPLVKVGLSGGGRCNLTNSFRDVKDFKKVYPRGTKLMRGLFRQFDNNDCVKWFESHGVELVTLDDQTIFPKLDSSQVIIDTFLRLCDVYGVNILLSHKVTRVVKEDDGYCIESNSNRYYHDAVVITTGGAPTLSGLSMLDGLDLKVENPVPSLFTFNIPGDKITNLMGTTADGVLLSFRGMPFKSTGVVLITHWGLSGPAVLKLSSYAAKELAMLDYNVTLSVNWCGERDHEKAKEQLLSFIKSCGSKLVTNASPFGLSSRLWAMILEKSEVSLERRYSELGSKGINRIVAQLCDDVYKVCGKSRFRDEFVTCGGVSLNNISISTMESTKHSNLYFAGEVLNVDAVTGGFNLQAAWSMGYAVAISLVDKIGKE